MGSGASTAAEDIVAKIVNAIQKNDGSALKTTLNVVFNNVSNMQKEHATLKEEHAVLQVDHTAVKEQLENLRQKLQSDTATVRLTVPSTVADPAIKNAKGEATLGIKHMTTAEHDERLDWIQKQAADNAGVFAGTAYRAAGEGDGGGVGGDTNVGRCRCGCGCGYG